MTLDSFRVFSTLSNRIYRLRRNSITRVRVGMGFTGCGKSQDEGYGFSRAVRCGTDEAFRP